MRFDGATTQLLDVQAGAISRVQLIQCGFEGPQIDAMLRRGHLERAGHGVYRRTGSGNHPHQDAVLAVLRCRPVARIAGARLLGAIGVEGFDVTDPFLVLVPAGRSVRNVAFDVRTDHAPDLHAARYGPMPGVTPARNLVEMAAAVGLDDDAIMRVFDRSRWRGVLTTAKVEDAVRALRRHPGARRLARLFALGSAEPESPGERNLATIVDGVGPPLAWQVWIAPDIRVDGLWRDCALVIEYQGEATHTDDRDRQRDAARFARIRALGYEIIVVDKHDLAHPDALRARLAAARARRLEQLRVQPAQSQSR